MNHDQPRRSSRIAAQQNIGQQNNPVEPFRPPHQHEVIARVQVQDIPLQNEQLGHLERSQIDALRARRNFNVLRSTRGRRSHDFRQRLLAAEQNVAHADEAVVQAEEELIARAGQRSPLILQQVQNQRNDVQQAQQTLNQLRSVRGRPSELRRQQLLEAEQRQLIAEDLLATTFRQLEQVFNY